MDKSRAREILQSLADGRDPVTGATFPPDSPYQQADTVRALYAALDAFDRAAVSQVGSPPISDFRPPTSGAIAPPPVQPAPRRPIDPNRPKLGLKWTPEEDQQLRDAFTAKTPYPAIAAAHGRSTGAITSRLVRLGLIQDDFNHPAHRRPTVSPSDRATVLPPDLSPPPALSTTEGPDRLTTCPEPCRRVQLPDRSPPPPPRNPKPDDDMPF